MCGENNEIRTSVSSLLVSATIAFSFYSISTEAQVRRDMAVKEYIDR